MSDYICLDSSVLVKVLVPEEDSEKAAALMEKIIDARQTVVVPDFAWVEVGSVLRKKVNRKLITGEQAEIVWQEFGQLGITYVNDTSVMRVAWRIAQKEKLSTLYDAAYLAVAEIISRQTGEPCEFWTADERLVNSVENKGYIKLLRDLE